MSAVSTAARLEQRINRASAWVLRHWLMFANCLMLMYAGLPWLAPLARAAGFERFGQLLFLLYLPLCHQRAERSFTVFGYQVAFCHRCVAMYTSILAGGLLFGLLRGRLRAAPLKLGGLLLLPMLLDGGSHLLDDVFGLGLRSGSDAIGSVNFALRMLTGLLVGVAALLVLFPRLERDLRASEALVEI